MIVRELIEALNACDPQAPVAVLFDDQSGIATDISVLSAISDPPDWADPRTVYLDTHGG